MEKIESIANVISPSACEKALLAYLYPLDTSLFIYRERELLLDFKSALMLRIGLLMVNGNRFAILFSHYNYELPSLLYWPDNRAFSYYLVLIIRALRSQIVPPVINMKILSTQINKNCWVICSKALYHNINDVPCSWWFKHNHEGRRLNHFQFEVLIVNVFVGNFAGLLATSSQFRVFWY